MRVKGIVRSKMCMGEWENGRVSGLIQWNTLLCYIWFDIKLIRFTLDLKQCTKWRIIINLILIFTLFENLVPISSLCERECVTLHLFIAWVNGIRNEAATNMLSISFIYQVGLEQGTMRTRRSDNKRFVSTEFRRVCSVRDEYTTIKYLQEFSNTFFFSSAVFRWQNSFSEQKNGVQVRIVSENRRKCSILKWNTDILTSFFIKCAINSISTRWKRVTKPFSCGFNCLFIIYCKLFPYPLSSKSCVKSLAVIVDVDLVSEKEVLSSTAVFQGSIITNI